MSQQNESNIQIHLILFYVSIRGRTVVQNVVKKPHKKRSKDFMLHLQLMKLIALIVYLRKKG